MPRRTWAGLPRSAMNTGPDPAAFLARATARSSSRPVATVTVAPNSGACVAMSLPYRRAGRNRTPAQACRLTLPAFESAARHGNVSRDSAGQETDATAQVQFRCVSGDEGSGDANGAGGFSESAVARPVASARDAPGFRGVRPRFRAAAMAARRDGEAAGTPRACLFPTGFPRMVDVACRRRLICCKRRRARGG